MAILDNKTVPQLPLATTIDGAEWVVFWSNTNQRLERIEKSKLEANPSISTSYFGLVTSSGTTTTSSEITTTINNAGFTIAAGQIKLLKCNVLIDSVVYVKIYQYKPNAVGDYGVGDTEIVFSDLYEIEEKILNQNTETTSIIALGDIGSSTIEDYINANDDVSWDLQADVIYIFTATISSDELQYLYVGIQPQYIGSSYNAVTSADFLLLEGENLIGASVEGVNVLSTGEATGAKFLGENGDGTSSWKSIPGGGDLLSTNNLSDVANAATARTNLGLNTTANQSDSADKRFMTDAQETKLDSVESGAQVNVTPDEEDILGTATYDATNTGTVNLDLDTFVDHYMILTGNTTITVSNTPSSGESFVRNLIIKSTATETLTLPVSWIVVGEYTATTAENYFTIKFTNYPTVGLKVTCYINQDD